LAESASPEKRCARQQEHVSADIEQHLQVVCSLIDARRVARQEIIELVTEILRQLRIDKGKRLVYRGCDADNRSP
jgi:hypothetical protein